MKLAGVLLLYSAVVAADPPDKRAFEKVCGACHSASLAAEARSEREWSETIDRMLEIGARGSADEIGLVRRYLTRTLTLVNVNTASSVQIASVLSCADKPAQAIVEYRTAHGAFRTLDDLQKVPGIEAVDLEAHKDRIVFR